MIAAGNATLQCTTIKWKTEHEINVAHFVDPHGELVVDRAGPSRQWKRDSVDNWKIGSVRTQRERRLETSFQQLSLEVMLTRVLSNEYQLYFRAARITRNGK